MADNEPGTPQQQREKVKELVKDARICMFTTMTPDGRHVSRPMALQDVEFDGDLWFFAYADSDKVAQVRVHPAVNVAFTDAKQHAWVSVTGDAQVVEDRSKAEELWNPLLKAWFPDGLETRPGDPRPDSDQGAGRLGGVLGVRVEQPGGHHVRVRQGGGHRQDAGRRRERRGPPVGRPAGPGHPFGPAAPRSPAGRFGLTGGRRLQCAFAARPG